MDNTDLISVIIPTYNRAHLIKRSAESILNQTYKNIENTDDILKRRTYNITYVLSE